MRSYSDTHEKKQKNKKNQKKQHMKYQLQGPVQQPEC